LLQPQRQDHNRGKEGAKTHRIGQRRRRKPAMAKDAQVHNRVLSVSSQIMKQAKPIAAITARA
jgi:hypothetical protein